MDNGLNLIEIAAKFSDEDAARTLLEQMRWGANLEHAACPHCGVMEPYRLTPKATSQRPGRKGLWKCRGCRKQFTVTVGTVFECSHIPIRKWIMALYLMAASKKGMSAHQLYRMLDLKSYKSAWFMAHRLRYAMMEGPHADLLRGVVEVDETYIGGRRRLNRGGSKGHPGEQSNKSPVVALVERKGRVRAMSMPRITQENLADAIYGNVDLNATMMTDEFSAYGRIGRQMKKHETVNHSKDEYVRGTAHTNTVEGFFSLLKRGINGTYHHVGRGHLNRYCDEFAFRYNARKVSDGERAALVVKGADGKRLTYKMPAAS